MRRVLLVSLAVGLLGCAREQRAGLPAAGGSRRASLPWEELDLAVPPDPELLDGIARALDFRRREEFDRLLDARDPGELLEHATASELAVERGYYGVDDLFVIGDELFDYEFRPEQGLGNALGGRPEVRAGGAEGPNSRRVHEGEFGGPDAHGCSACHFKGGPDGAGNNTQNAFLRGDGRSARSADVRNPPHLLGLGAVELLARQMSAALAAARERAVTRAAARRREVEVVLETKGVSFGVLRARPDGTVDLSGIEGIDADLVVKPFGWKGHRATLREMAEESFRLHLGIVSMHEQESARAAGAGGADLGDGIWYDVDRDGTTRELDEGMLTSMVVYLAQLEVPVVRPPRLESLQERFARGRALFEAIGCESCHRPVLGLEGSTLEVRGRGVESSDGEPVRVDVARDGDHPKIEPRRLHGTTFDVRLFSDLKRHDMGEELATPTAHRGIPPRMFLTRSLWGLAFTSPYLHDGRAPSVDDAIRLHGGEAAPVRDRYVALSSRERGSLLVFLLSLTREPRLFVP